MLRQGRQAGLRPRDPPPTHRAHPMSKLRHPVLALALSALAAAPTLAADWSDTALSVRYGTRFAEPFNNEDIAKTIIAVTHASGYKYGTNFFNADVLLSDSKDPKDGVPGASGAQEVYLVYRHLLDIGKVTGTSLAFGPVRGVGVTAGFDLNSKNDGYASRKRMVVLGPTLMFDVPGFLNLSLLALFESNAPNGIPGRFNYDTHPALASEWSLPVFNLPHLRFEGYALYIGHKGKNEFGGDTKPETHIDMRVMADVGALFGGPKGTFKAGIAYEYWRNKFGNDAGGPAGPGAIASTPMIRVQYHF